MPIRVPVEQTGLERSIQKAAQKAGRNLKLDLSSSAKDIKSLEQPLGRITGKADEFTKSMEAANARVLAFGASVGILNAVIQSFKSLVSTTIEVEKSIGKINSILNATVPQLNSLKQQIFDIAKNTEQTFDVVADAALELSRQGLSATEVTKRLNDALILSRLSGLSASEAVSGLTAAVNSFSKAGLTTGDVLNKISAAANQFAVSERDLIEGFKRSASVAEQAGVSIDELGGIITAVQQRTARGGAVIGNSFKTIFTRIGRAENLDLLDSLGVQITDISGKILPATKLIENLAKTLEDLDQTQVRNVSEKIGGGFQIAPLLAALSDYSSETSVAIQATQTFANATNEAYKKNEVQNLTLSAAINKTSLSVKELANALGELGVLDTFKGILESLNSFAEGVKNVLQGDDIGSTFARGIVKGISGVLLKGGIALFAFIIGKLALDLAKFGVTSLKSFLGLNREAEKLKNIEQQIVSTLLNDKNVRSDILNIEKTSKNVEDARLKQAQYFTTALNSQLAVLQQMQAVASSIAPSLGATIAKKGGPVNIKRSAGGFLPVGAEQKDISRGVGGAPSGAKPVVIPNFAFGGGQKGTMIANSSEYIVPNFAGGGSAIFNQDMVKSMGLPSGAKKINAAGGFIPNFAPLKFNSFKGSDGNFYQNKAAANAGVRSGNITEAELNEKAFGSQLLARKATEKKKKKQLDLSVNGRRYGIASIGTDLKAGNETPFDIAPKPLSSFASSSSLSSSTAKALIEQGYNTISFRKVQVKSLQENELQNAIEKNRNRLFDYFLQPLASYGKDLLGSSGLFKGNDLNDATKLIDTKNNKKLFSKGAEGGIFESAVDLITKGISGLPSIGDSETSPFDFEETGSASSELKKAFGFSDALKKADAKRTASTTTVGSIVGKALRDGEESSYIKSLAKRRLKSVSKKASTGYIPNFAMSPIEDAIQREKDAGVPINQIRINQSGKLRNSQNPNGLAVTNTRDEPTGAIPKNAARGYTPNFASQGSAYTASSNSATGGGSSGFEKATGDLAGKFLGLSIVAGIVQSSLSNVAGESDGALKSIANFTSGLVSAISTLALVKTIAPDAKIPGIDKLVGGGAGKLGTLFVGLGKKLSGLIPLVGGAFAAFQVINGIGKLFGKDFGRSLGETLGYIKTPAQEAAASLEKLSQAALKTALETGKASEDPFKNFLERVGTVSDEALKASLSESGKKKVESGQDTGTIAFAEALGRSLLDGKAGANILGALKESTAGSDSADAAGLEFEKRRQAIISGDTVSGSGFTGKGTSGLKVKALRDLQFATLESFATPDEFKDITKLVKSGKGEQAGKNISSIIEKLPDPIKKEYERLVDKISNTKLGGEGSDKAIREAAAELAKFKEVATEASEEFNAIKTIEAEISKIRRQSLFDTDQQLTNLKSQVELSNQLVAASKNSTAAEKLGAEFQNEKLQSQRKLLQEQSKSTTSLLEGVTDEIVSKVGPNQKAETAKAYSDLIQKANQQLREQGKIDVDGLVNQARKNELISGNTKVLERALTQANEQNTALAKQESIQLSINNITKAQNALNKIQLDQELQKEASFKRRLDLLKEGSSLEQEIANAQDDIAKARIDSGAINGNQFSKFSATEQKAGIDEKALIRNLGIEQKNIFADAARDFYDRALQSNVVLSENLAKKIEGFSTGATSPNELSNVADEINTAYKEQAKAERDALLDKQIAEIDNILAMRANIDLFGEIVKSAQGSAGFGGSALGNPNNPFDPNNIPGLFDRNATPTGGSLLNNNTDDTAINNLLQNRADKVKIRGTDFKPTDLISGGLEISNVFAKIDLAGLKVDASLIALANSVKEAGGSLTTLANLIRNEINGIGERIAQSQFNLATSADPSQIATSLGSLRRESVLKETGDIGRANKEELIFNKKFEIETATDNATKERLKFELQKTLELLDIRNQILKTTEGSAERDSLIKTFQEKTKEQQSLASQLNGRLIKTSETIESEFNEAFVNATVTFKDGLVSGLTEAIKQGDSLGDVLLNAASKFVDAILEAQLEKNIQNIINGIGGGGGGGGGGGFFNGVKKFFGFNSGGMVSSGSGMRDDVPAALSSGEYVVRKNAVMKYGPNFMDKINNGSYSPDQVQVLDKKVGGNEDPQPEQEEGPLGIKKFFIGGLVDAANWDNLPEGNYIKKDISNTEKQFYNQNYTDQTGVGGFSAPGDRGAGAISGKENLLRFAGQSFTSGATDVIASSKASGGGSSFVDLETESARLSVTGRLRGSPLQEAIQTAKGEAFDLRADQLANEKEYADLKKIYKKALKDKIKGIWINAAINIAAAAAGQYFSGGEGAGAKAGEIAASQASGDVNTTSYDQTSGAPQIRSASARPSGIDYTAAANQAPKQSLLSRGFQYAANFGKSLITGDLSYITPTRPQSFDSVYKTPSSTRDFINYANQQQGFKVKSTIKPRDIGTAGIIDVSGQSSYAPEILGRNAYNNLSYLFNEKNPSMSLAATGGYISERAGIDTVPAMLSGGEFVMNSAATQRVGKDNLEKLNSGSSDETGSGSANSEKIIAKIDELIEEVKKSTGNVSINVNNSGRESGNSSQGGSAEEERQQDRSFAKRLKSEVIKIIENEKRIGGTLRGV